MSIEIISEQSDLIGSGVAVVPVARPAIAIEGGYGPLRMP